MSPFPATPTPRRFLLPKRGQSLQTPNATQFQSTPRFGSSSASQFASVRKKAQKQNIEDVDENSSEEWEDEHEPEPEPELVDHDMEPVAAVERSVEDSHLDIESSVEVEEEEADTSPSYRKPSPIKHRQLITPDKRFLKKRRITLSPELDTQSTTEEREISVDDTPWQEEAATSPPAHEDEEESIRSIKSSSSPDSSDAENDNSSQHHETRLQQPTFQRAPKFKASSPGASDLLSSYFSPQRRGARFLPHGLAATLQAQLSEVKGWDSMEETGQATARETVYVRVETVRPGRRMHLVGARPWDETTTTTTTRHDQSHDDNELQKIILAGQGTLSGLGRSAEVCVGSKVVVRQPVWDIELEGKRWVVACDWQVEI